MPELNSPSSPEIPKIPEVSLEGKEARDASGQPEQEPQPEAQQPSEEPQPASVGQVLAASVPKKEPGLMRVERVLEDNLSDVYVALPKDVRLRFRARGEEVARVLRGMIDSARVNTKKVFKLIREWLKLIPGVNRFFLEQEAKIKTDRIVAMAEERKKELSKQA